MSTTLGRILEISFLLILFYLVLSNGASFSQVVTSMSGAYTSSVKTLQGRS